MGVKLMKTNKKLIGVFLAILSLLLYFNMPVYANATNGTTDYNIFLSIPLEDSGLEYEVNGDGYATGPTSFAVQGNFIYILDGEKNKVFIFKDGKKVNDFQVKGLLAASDIRVSKNIIYVVDKETKKLASFQQDGKQIALIDLALYSNKGTLTLDLDKDGNVLLKTGNGSLTKFDKDLKIGSVRQNFFKFNKNSNYKGNLLLSETGLNIDFNSNELLGSMSLTHIDKSGNLFVTTEELLDVPIITVEQTVKEYDSKGRLIGTARVPLELYKAHPDRYTDVTEDGVFALVPKANSIDVVKLNTITNFTSRMPELKKEFEKSYKNPESDINKNPSMLAINYLTRSQVENNGYYINNYNWTLNSNNRKSMSGVTFPDWLSTVNIPYSATGIPYCWGGFDSLNTSSSSSWSNYGNAMSYGANAGNVYCSGYYKSGTAGLDCSGYVSACFAFTSKWGTGDFYSNASLFNDINVSQLGNCDIVVHPTDHIVLWKGADYGNSDHFFTYEATTSGLDKCKAYDRYWSSLSGYKCRTYKYY